VSAAETWLPAILAMAGLVLASGFFSSSETALFYLSRDDLRAFRVGPRRQRLVASLLANPDRLLTAVLFWNLLINLTYFAITIVLSLLSWTGLARVVRGKLLSLREEDFAVAANLMGASTKRIIGRHLVPGFASHLIASASLAIPEMILGETALSFLGLGLRPPVTSWGVLLNEAQNIQVVVLYPWLMAPMIPVILTILAFNFLGDGLRDAADPYK